MSWCIFDPMFNNLGEGDRLENLQRESWQLELLVTGFALAGMISGAEEFFAWSSRMLTALSGNELQSGLAGGLLIGTSFAYVITLINFFFHVVLRCLWIGAIGSRSVMGNTIIARRKLAPRFERFLRRRSGNFDRYIGRLDDAASLVFAFTFLLIIVTVSFLTVVLFLTLLGLAISKTNDIIWVVVLLGILTTLVVLFGLVYLVDFLTGGWLKRFRRFSAIYYPFYRLFGWITFARIYRPLYYNLLNRRGGRWLVVMLVPYLAICLYLLTLEITPNKYVAGEYIDEDRNSAFVLDPAHYADTHQDDDPMGEISIPSQVIRQSPLRVDIPLLHRYEQSIEYICPELTQHYESVIHSGLFDRGEVGVYRAPDSLQSHHVVLTREVMNCLTAGIGLSLDNREIPLDDVLLSETDQYSYSQLVKFIPLDSLTTGLHELRLRQMRVSGRDTARDRTLASEVVIPFYYAPG